MTQTSKMRSFSILFIALALCECRPRERSISIDSKSYKDNELYRSQFHFTPPSGWMNDPNGMVYYDGEYHLFYQYYPDSTVWGPMHWGHAVSEDLLHWEHLPVALYPDSLGYIFSGSAVVDWKNTSGLGSRDKPAMIAIFTYHDAVSEKKGRVDYQTQGIAYSLDRGRTWKKYQHNPVLPNPGIQDFRDPKVSWHEAGKQWVMALAVKDHIEFYRSPNLTKWSKLSEFGKTMGAHGGVWECPDLFPLPDGKGNMKWVLFVSINPGGPQGGSATQYFIGDFDGQKFTSQDTVTRWIDHGADNYAGVTWSDVPTSDGRRLFLGWMSNWQYGQIVPTDTWRSAMTLPREVSLMQGDKGYELKFKPVAEINRIEGEMRKSVEHATLDNPLSLISFDLKDDEKEFSLTISNDQNEKVLVSLQRGVLAIDRTSSGLTNFHEEFPAIHKHNLAGRVVNKVSVYIDVASIEVFANDGEIVLTDIVFPTRSYNQVHLEKKDPQFRISTLSSTVK